MQGKEKTNVYPMCTDKRRTLSRATRRRFNTFPVPSMDRSKLKVLETPSAILRR